MSEFFLRVFLLDISNFRLRHFAIEIHFIPRCAQSYGSLPLLLSSLEHLDSGSVLGFLDLLGSLGESDYGGEDHINELQVQILRQVKVQGVLILLRLVLWLVFNHLSVEGTAPFFDLISEVRLPRAYESEQCASEHRSYLADHLNNLFRLAILRVGVEEVEVGIGKVATPDSREHSHVVKVLSQEICSDCFVHTHAIQAT
jgi:hypothetical protein